MVVDRYSKCIRGYYITKEAWYYNNFPEFDDEYSDEIMFGFYYSDNDGTEGEMAVRWHKVANEKVPRLEIFNDGWGALNLLQDVIQHLASYNNKIIDADCFVKVLKDCGFVDITKRKNPYK